MTEQFMSADREGKVAGIRQQIECGAYEVDPRAVADAILRRLSQRPALLDADEAYNKCSYPDSSGPPSPNHTPLWP
jgi:Anti-sigma-28 factor, FlgM